MPDPEPTLDELFPNLAPVLRGMEGRAGVDTLRADPEHSGVTDADISAYFAHRLNGGGRTIAPVVSGQVPVGPTFRSGTTGAPPVGGMEDGPVNQADVPATPPRQGNQPPNPSPPVQPAEMPQPFQTEGDGQDGNDDKTDSTPDGTAPGSTDDLQDGAAGAGDEGGAGVLAPPAPPSVIDLGDGVVVPRDRILAYEQFNERLAQDPQLAQLIQEYVTTGRVPGRGDGGGQGVPGPQSGQPAASAPAASPFDNPPADFVDDPAFMAVWEANRAAYNAQQATINQLAQSQQLAMQQQAQEQQQRNIAIVNQASEAFKASRNLTDDDVMKLRATAARLNVLDSLLSGIDPLTGAPSSPDPISAVQRSLEIAYYSLPEYRARDLTNSQQQQTQERRRKAKVGSLSGSSGSVPRSTPAPTTPEGNRAAMLSEVGAMMNGSWTGEG